MTEYAFVLTLGRPDAPSTWSGVLTPKEGATRLQVLMDLKRDIETQTPSI